MLRVAIILPLLACVSACVSVPRESEPAPQRFVAAAEIIEPARSDDGLAGDEPLASEAHAIPAPLPVQVRRLESAPVRSVPPEEAIREGREQALIEPSVDGYVNAIQIYPYTEGALYRLYASPNQVSDIALERGETLVSVSSGDTVRWVVGDTVSGAGAERRAHVLVKPITTGLRTNLMIATDRRTYHLELESVASGYMAALSWRYPADAIGAIVSRHDAAAPAPGPVTAAMGLAVEALHFGYQISGDTPPWRPVRAFDDGRQVFIQMPQDVAAGEMPPLFVLSEAGGRELVNYRVRGRYYVVDRLFSAAELRLGERRQSVVRITRSPARAGRASVFGG